MQFIPVTVSRSIRAILYAPTMPRYPDLGRALPTDDRSVQFVRFLACRPCPLGPRLRNVWADPFFKPSSLPWVIGGIAEGAFSYIPWLWRPSGEPPGAAPDATSLPPVPAEKVVVIPSIRPPRAARPVRQLCSQDGGPVMRVSSHRSRDFGNGSRFRSAFPRASRCSLSPTGLPYRS